MLGGGRSSMLAAGRLAVRAVFSAGAVDFASATCTETPSSCQGARHFTTTACKEQATVKVQHETQSEVPTPLAGVHASQCGFAKTMKGGPSKVLEQGIYGEDACFVSTHKNTCVVGVADGVGGWRKYGIDPSKFSSKLMRECEKVVEKGEFEPSEPKKILDRAFIAMSDPPRPIGSSTACILIVHQHTLYSANLGDSGFIVVRGGKVLARSTEQVHYFNAPFQLSLLPDGYEGAFGDTPDKAEEATIELQKGDIIVLATDGLWDNVPEQTVIEQLRLLSGPAEISKVCNSLALTARRLAFDSRTQSPFSKKALAQGYNYPGGKPDDITLVLLLIV
ncbi:unnamed protein product, partial [Mesorhabditis belari]|uniref:Protein phosphatase n=1 Tax=Mesorhabditis belari TaxID=2138241 RepID=A0AAF3EAZ8_9BILA